MNQNLFGESMQSKELRSEKLGARNGKAWDIADAEG